LETVEVVTTSFVHSRLVRQYEKQVFRLADNVDLF